VCVCVCVCVSNVLPNKSTKASVNLTPMEYSPVVLSILLLAAITEHQVASQHFLSNSMEREGRGRGVEVSNKMS